MRTNGLIQLGATTEGVRQPPRSESWPKLLTILVAEDDANDALLLRLAFAKAGVNARVHFARDGIEAKDYLQGVPPFANRAAHPVPDLLVLDLEMPFVNGFEVLEWLRQQPGSDRIIVVVLSGSSWHADIDRAHALGADFFMKKPLDLQQFVELVGWLEEKRSIPFISSPLGHQSNLPPQDSVVR